MNRISDLDPYPNSRAARDAWILARRVGIARTEKLHPRHPSHWLRESEPDPAGGQASILTVFLTNKECPWRCLMCDLWRHTLEETVPVGAIPEQLERALAADQVERPHQAQWLKLYNAGSFFDSQAIPAADWPKLALKAQSFERLVVECHPKLIREDRILPFQRLLGSGTRLELALGLETAHPEVLERLNKGIDREAFQRSAHWIRHHDMDLRVFVLVKPPFLNESEALEWACRSIDFAFDCGANTISLIPTRSGNGALESLSARGEFAPPRPETLESALAYGIQLGRGRVFADTWDLEKLEPNAIRCSSLRARLEHANQEQRIQSLKEDLASR
ncbi:MAG: radical SAM protein [Verrucomicrobia bacterium]|nr:radical SAM protein [Verrucomicrobiota bacterium]